MVERPTLSYSRHIAIVKQRSVLMSNTEIAAGLPIPSDAEGILATLKRLGQVRDDTLEIFASRTRDRDPIAVYRDALSGVIFIDNYYVGDDTYERGNYRLIEAPLGGDLEDLTDTERRCETYEQFYVGKEICDFGCGAGSFVKRVSPVVRSAYAVELQQSFRENLTGSGIRCVSDLSEIDEQMDTMFLFHSFEHLPFPITALKQIREKLKGGGKGRIVIEVPHARDFLIDRLCVAEFIKFTLWSQHLLLHTRSSLEAFLRDAGFRDIVLEGVQRYGLSNHLNWLRSGTAGGHKSNLSVIDSPSLKLAYADALSRLDANDTIVAVATT